MQILTARLFLILAITTQGVIGGSLNIPQAQPRDPRATMTTGTGSISGRVTSADTGAPIQRAQVMLSGESGQRVAVTDLGGRYGFSKLPAGRYSLVAVPSPNRAGYQSSPYGGAPATEIARGKPIELADGQRLENIDITLLRTGVIAGRVTHIDGQPAAGIQVNALQIRPGRDPAAIGHADTDDLGRFRLFNLPPGDYMVMASTGPGFQIARGQLEPDQEAIGLAPTYAPGTLLPADAARVRVARGAETAADIQLVETRVYSISGTVVNSKGESAPNMHVMLMRADESGRGGFGTAVNLNGTFAVRNLVPGTYDVVARYTPPRAPGPVPTGPEPEEFASVQVELTTGNVDGVVLMTKPGAVVTGEIVFDETPPAGARTNLFAEPGQRRTLTSLPRIELKDTTFMLSNVFTPVMLRGSLGAGPNWALQSVRLNGNDITDVPTTFTANDSGHLQVVFTSRAPAVDGVVLDDAGKPTMDGIVVLFSQDPSAWPRRSSYLRTTRAIKDGKYRIVGLREGRYYAVAVPLDLPVSTVDPDAGLFEALSKVATPLVLNPGERRSVDLTIVRPPQ
jgi:hypothetical protein